VIRLAQLGLIVLAVGVWELAVRSGAISNRLLAAPSEAARALATILGDPNVQASLATTLGELALAITFAVPTGLALGFVAAEQAWADRLLTPLLYLGTAVPKSLFLPLFILALGIGINQKVVFGIVQAFFVVAVATLVALRGIPLGLTQLGRSLKASPRQMYWHIYLPYMLPVIVQAVRIGIIYAATGILFAEMYAARGGLGRLINLWGSSYDLPKMMAGTLLAALGAIAINSGLRLCEDRLGRWRSAGG
jgi:ABC-type nitrate/sulfonate/bicarbonate transport system permease component